MGIVNYIQPMGIMANVTQNIVRNVSTSSSNDEEWRKAQPNTISSGSTPLYEKDEEEEQEIQVVDNKIVLKQITFPERLMKVLSHNEYTDIVSWLPHGQSFLIYDRKKFEDIVLPRFFKGTKFTSFTRKLNRWRFERIARGVETGAFKHKLFQRDNAALCKKMTCQKKHEIKKRSIDENSDKPARDFSFVTDILNSKANEEVKEEAAADSIVSNPNTTASI